MMRPMRLSELQEPLQGRITGEDVYFTNVFTDSRQIAKNGLFVALVGENFDGNDYVESVAENGAVAALVSRSSSSALPQLCSHLRCATIAVTLATAIPHLSDHCKLL